MASKIVKPDDMGSVGLTTVPELAWAYGSYKGHPTVLEITIDKTWLHNQAVRHETGGPGHSAFLLKPIGGLKASIPPEAIKAIRVWTMKAKGITKRAKNVG